MGDLRHGQTITAPPLETSGQNLREIAITATGDALGVDLTKLGRALGDILSHVPDHQLTDYVSKIRERRGSDNNLLSGNEIKSLAGFDGSPSNYLGWFAKIAVDQAAHLRATPQTVKPHTP